jgi:hypothetical protein
VLAPSIAVVLGAAAICTAAAAQDDPFAVVRSHTGAPVSVPPRALALIPERHVGRVVRVVDELERVDPQIDELARALGLTSANAIQLRTREAGMPVFVVKTDATITTVLSLRLGAPIELTGMLLERDRRYCLLATDVRPASSGGRAH